LYGNQKDRGSIPHDGDVLVLEFPESELEFRAGEGNCPGNSGLGTGPPNDFQRFRAGEVEFLEQFWSRSRSTERIFKNPLRSPG
jgi:hypothetical protein